MTKLLIVTTPILSNIEIQRYIGSITANVVLGVNFFADFAASFTDVFGGKSETYQSKLNCITTEVNSIMEDKAIRKGANCIIDYKLQFNEISGKGKQMFMVTATGTACIITMPRQETVENIGQVSFSQIRRQYLLALYSQQLKAHAKLSEKAWENIFSLNIFELLPELTDEYFRIRTIKSEDVSLDYDKFYSSKFEEFLFRLGSEDIGKNVYSHINSNPDLVVNLAIKYNLFNPEIIIEQISEGHLSLAIDLLRSHKDYYTKGDLQAMKRILSLFENLPDKGSFQVVKSGVFSKTEEEVYVCPSGHKSPKGSKYCPYCNVNIKGFSSNQDQLISQFKNLTLALETIINN